MFARVLITFIAFFYSGFSLALTQISFTVEQVTVNEWGGYPYQIVGQSTVLVCSFEEYNLIAGETYQFVQTSGASVAAPANKTPSLGASQATVHCGKLLGCSLGGFIPNCSSGLSLLSVSFSVEAPDTDGDGLKDDVDLDDDNDGIEDLSDNCRVVINPGQSDIDSDGTGDACDSDRDGDGVANATDHHPNNPFNAGDPDGDSFDTLVDNCPYVFNWGQSDLDNDGMGDACDDDLDGDGRINSLDSHPRNASLYDDNDRDLVNADNDNCPDTKNPGQSDIDADGEGDACDADIDGDTYANVDDAFPLNKWLPTYAPVYEIFGLAVDGQFGAELRSFGDIDQDGIPDFIVAANGELSKSVSVHSGASGAVIHRLDNLDTDYARLFVSGAGDVDNDGIPDFMIGQSASDVSPGKLLIYSGLDAVLIRQINAPNGSLVFARQLAAIGDVNDDGFDDVVAGDHAGGMVWIFSGLDGSVLLSISGRAQDRFAYSFDVVGDFDDDGKNDLWVAAPDGRNGDGIVYTYSSFDGYELDTNWANVPGEGLGETLRVIDDVEDDGFDDFIVGGVGNTPGSLRVYSGTGGWLYQITEPGINFGLVLSSTGDADADGNPDIIASDYLADFYGSSSGLAYVYPGWDGDYGNNYGAPMIYRLYGKAGDQLGTASDKLSDIDSDGHTEFLVGSTGRQHGANGIVGSVKAYSMAQAYLDSEGDGMPDQWELDNSLQPLQFDAGHNNDSDGFNNLEEYRHGTSPMLADTDGDGFEDHLDNCPTVLNPGQSDNDSDGIGNACDLDVDGDGVVEALDSFPLNPVFW